jgi:hypothetical protein
LLNRHRDSNQCMLNFCRAKVQPALLVTDHTQQLLTRLSRVSRLWVLGFRSLAAKQDVVLSSTAG